MIEGVSLKVQRAARQEKELWIEILQDRALFTGTLPVARERHQYNRNKVIFNQSAKYTFITIY
jgi:hypothetical protein